MGCGLALAGLAAYNLAVFGQVLDFGYRYSPYRADFFMQDLANVSWTTRLPDGSTVALWPVLVSNLSRWIQPLLLGWPALPLALLGLFLALHRLDGPLPAWLAALWLLVTYAPYTGSVFFGITRELAVPFNRGWGFYIVDRYVFPASLPVALLASGFLARLARWQAGGLALIYATGSVWLYLQALAAS